MKKIRSSFRSCAIIGGLIASLTFIHAQTVNQSISCGTISTDDSNVNWNALSDFEVELMAVEATTPLPAESVTRANGYYSAQYLNWPPLPGNQHGLPLWSLGEGLYLLDDRQFDYAALKAKKMSTTAMEASPSGDNSNGDMNSFTFNASGYTVDYGSNLWIANFAISSNNAVGILSNSVADISYEIQYKHNLVDSQWLSAGFVLGSEVTNWTAMVINNVSLTNNAFFRIRSWEDDGSGLPLWWQMQYFGHTGVDPYGDPDVDGWNNLQEFQNGTDPLGFYLPPAPKGLTASYNTDNTATVSWQPSPGPVTGYTVERHYYHGTTYPPDQSQTFNVSANTFSLQDPTPFNAPDWVAYLGLSVSVSYKIQAHYAGGDSAWSDVVWLEPDATDITLVAGPQGSAYFAARNLPAGTTALRLTRVDVWMEDNFGDSPSNTVSFYIPLSGGTNGLYLIPAAAAASPVDAYGYAWYWWFVQPVNANGQGTAQAVPLDWLRPDYVWGGYFSSLTGDSIDWLVPPYFDGRVQLKQNLIFKLRAATKDFPFAFTDVQGSDKNVFLYSANCVSASFIKPAGGFGLFDFLWPFGENTYLRNFVFSLADAEPSTNWPFSPLGHLSTGVSGNYDDFYYDPSYYPTPLNLTEPAVYQFQLNTTNGGTIPALLPVNSTRWLCSYPLDSPEMYFDGTNMVSLGYLEEIGVTPSLPDLYNIYTMASSARNYWGLPFLSTIIASSNQEGTGVEATTLDAGIQLQWEAVSSYFYAETVQPHFQTVEYNFLNQSPLPESTNFSTTSTSDLLITAVANPYFQIAGYAKLAVTNGYPGVYGYLGQYFDKAYKMDANGNVTTNTTGVLSPYGQFFATEPGPAALVTMPDIDTDARGTCTVYCVSLQLDKNHDGVMDTSFSGQDATSQASPATLWVNNDYDRLNWVDGSDLEQDDMEKIVNSVYYDQRYPESDCAFRGYEGKPAIPCTRDLEDYTRLWIPGLSNLMAVMPTNYTVRLTVNGSGQIRLFRAVESDGGTNYLFDELTASNQVVQSISLYVGLLTSASPITLSGRTNNLGEHFIWCGAQRGSAEVHFQILDGNTNMLADAAAYLELKDIKEMYERWTVGDVASRGPYDYPYRAVEGLTNGMTAFQYGPPESTNTPYILFVHGWNMKTWEKDRFAETAFKRLYWQGYQGRFGFFRWPTDNGFDGLWDAITDRRNYDNSEFNAWKSAPMLSSFLRTNLNAQYLERVYLMAHSMGNVVAGEALRWQQTES
jgi:hypothetical protein